MQGRAQVELSLEAVIVGVLLLTPLLLLLPTLAVFYALLTGLHLAAGVRPTLRTARIWPEVLSCRVCAH